MGITDEAMPHMKIAFSRDRMLVVDLIIQRERDNQGNKTENNESPMATVRATGNVSEYLWMGIARAFKSWAVTMSNAGSTKAYINTINRVGRASRTMLIGSVSFFDDKSVSN